VDDIFGTHRVELARSINPAIEVVDSTPELAISIGSEAPPASPTTIYAGSNGWNSLISSSEPVGLGDTENPFGAGVAACVAAANLFRLVMLGGDSAVDSTPTFSVLSLNGTSTDLNLRTSAINLAHDAVLVGLGAIGNGAAWALSRVRSISGRIHLIDPQDIELSNLQRYILAERSSDGRHKLDVVTPHFKDALEAVAHPVDWASFVETNGYHWDRVLVALDSARDRRAVQASLPRWIANA